MLHHPLRLEGFSLSTIQEKTGSRVLGRRTTPNRPSAESTPTAKWISCNSFDRTRAVPAARYPVQHCVSRRPSSIHRLITRYSIRQRSGQMWRLPQHSWPYSPPRRPGLRSRRFDVWKRLSGITRRNNRPSNPANEAAGSAKNTGEGGGRRLLKKQQLCSSPRRNQNTNTRTHITSHHIARGEQDAYREGGAHGEVWTLVRVTRRSFRSDEHDVR